MEKLLNATNVAVLVGVTVPTLTSWYKWKELNPDHELAKFLPDYTKISHVRYWERDAVESLLKFKEAKPMGRNGILGEVTQKYVKKGE